MIKRITLLAIISIMMLLSTCIGRVSGSSTISQNYEHTVYMESVSTHEMLALFTYRVGITVQTEPDGTWKENSHYQVIFSVGLEWYDSKLLPYGISLVFPKENLNLLGYSYSSNDVNVTVLWRGLGNPNNVTLNAFVDYDYYKALFSIGEARSFEGMTLKGAILLKPVSGYYVYNSTIVGERQLGNQQYFNAQNGIYVSVRAEENKPLSETTFQDFNGNVQKILNNLQLQIMALDIGIVILAILLVVAIFFVRRKRPAN